MKQIKRGLIGAAILLGGVFWGVSAQTTFGYQSPYQGAYGYGMPAGYGYVEKGETETAILPTWGIKTNLLYDLTATINLGVEFRLGGRTSLDIPFNYNPWTFQENRKWKHFLVQPEFRFWVRNTFEGSFFGLHGHYAVFNISHLPEPFSPFMQAYRFEGELWGAGISYGYRWNLGRHWGMEATIGAGFARIKYDRYECDDCGDYIESKTLAYFGPTKVGLNLIYSFGGEQVTRRKEKIRGRGGYVDKYNETIVGVPPIAAPPIIIEEPDYVIEKPVKPAYQPLLSTSYIIPEAEAIKERSLYCTAFIDFEQGKWQVRPGIGNNAAEIQKVHETLKQVVDDPNATVTGIAIVGYASPEGNWDNNLLLSEKRTQAVTDYIGMEYNFPRNIYTVRGAGEDWQGLDSLVNQSVMSSKHRVLNIIRSKDDDYDARERKLRSVAGGDVYQWIYDEFYPLLRRTDYRIDYTVVPFSIEEGRAVLKNRPNNLSLNELFLVANSYQPGTREFNEVFEIAVQQYPWSDVANINAAASALERRDTSTAAYYLAHVKDHTPAYWNNMGVMAWLQGDEQKAVDCFAQAGIQAAGNNAELEQYFRSIAD